MRRFFNGGWVLGLLTLLYVSGCSSAPPQVDQAKTYLIYKHQVRLAPPKDWKEHQEKSPDVPGEIAAVVFEPPTGFGHIAVTATDGIQQTQQFMNQLANGVTARQGKIVKQWYEHKLDEPDKDNAYHMEYALEDAMPGHAKQKGMQVQIFTQKKVLYSLVFQADPEVYDAHREAFLGVVKSFALSP